MKRFLLTSLVIIFTTISALAESLYRVECNTFLNVRENKSTSSLILGTIQNNEQITVYGIQDGWAQIKYNGKDAYISSDYIVPVKEIKQKTDKDFNIKDYIPSFSFEKTANTTWALWVILPLIAILYFIRKRIDNDVHQYYVWKNLGWLSVIGIVTSIFEIIYALGTQDFIWFCTSPRWWWIAVNFIIFGICTFQQVMAYITLTGYVSGGNIKIGIYSWPVCVILGIIFAVTGLPQEIAVGLIVIAQLIQAVIIFKEAMRYGNIFHAIFFTLSYLIFTVSTAILLIQFIAILIIVIIGFFLLKAFASSSGSSSSSYSSASSDNSSNDNNYEERYETEDGAKLHYDGFGDWHDDKGRHYKNTDAWGGRNMVRTDDD